MIQDTSDQEIIRECKSFKDALRMAAKKSGRSMKVIALELQERGHKIDEATLSLSLSENPSQKKNFPSEAIDDFITVTNNIPTRYLALKQGYGLVRLKSELEMENEKLKEQLEEERKKLDIIKEFMRDSGVSLKSK